MWAAVAGGVVSVLFLYWASRGVNLGQAWDFARRARIGPLLLAVALATSAFPLRVLRWRALLHTDQGQPLPIVPGWHAVAMGFMANNVFPFRAGELLRAFAASRLAPVRFTSAISSIAVERVLDGLTLLGTLVLGLAASGFPSDTRVGSLAVDDLVTRILLLSSIALAGALTVVVWPAQVERLVRLLPIPRVTDTLARLVHGIGEGFAVLRSPRRLFLAVMWSGVLWSVNALSFYVAFRAFGIEVDLMGAFVLQGILAFGIAIPSSPGYVGLFETAVVLGLALFGVPKDLAFTYGATYHVATFIPITLLGAWSVMRTSIGLRSLKDASP